MNTAHAMSHHPEPTEYPPYYEKYVSLVPPGEIMTTLEQQLDQTLAVLRSIPEAQGNSRYAPDKWSIKELIGHLTDTERIFAYRALRFARHDQTPLSSFEQDDYVREAAFDACQLTDLVAEFEHVRRANLYLFRHLAPAAWLRRGVANKGEVSVRALAYIIAGHERHHLEILKTRYLS